MSEDKGSSIINTESILSLNLERDEALHNASSNHFKYKDNIPQLDFSSL
jgi:hypothetical protein